MELNTPDSLNRGINPVSISEARRSGTPKRMSFSQHAIATGCSVFFLLWAIANETDRTSLEPIGFDLTFAIMIASMVAAIVGLVLVMGCLLRSTVLALCGLSAQWMSVVWVPLAGIGLAACLVMLFSPMSGIISAIRDGIDGLAKTDFAVSVFTTRSIVCLLFAALVGCLASTARHYYWRYHDKSQAQRISNDVGCPGS